MSPNSKIPVTELSNDQIIVLSIYKIIGERGLADAEDIAIAADQLIKGKYRWKKYKKYIDLGLIKTLLGNARDRAKLVTGGKEGWGLSDKGLALANIMQNKISYAGQRISRLSKYDKQKIEFELDRIIHNKAFINFQKNLPIDKGDVRRIFKIDEYSTEEVIGKNIKDLLKLMKNNNEIYNFLKYAKEEL